MFTSVPRSLKVLNHCCIALLIFAAMPGSVAVAQQPKPPTGVTLDGSYVFSDDFEFVASRTGVSLNVFTARGWSGAKAENVPGSAGGASGYIYTSSTTPTGSGRSLALEARPSMASGVPGFAGGQTDFYLQYGSGNGDTNTIPANLWIQFWTYTAPESLFAARDKVLYPTRSTYPSSDLGWQFLWGSAGYELGSYSAPAGARVFGVFSNQADYRVGYDPGLDSAMNHKLFMNVSRTPMLAGRWYQVKLHLDTSGQYINPTNGQPSGVYEAWIRERGQPNWTKVADYRPGVTGGPNGLYWPLTANERTGHRALRMPTTVNQFDGTILIDDFVISNSEP